MRKYRIQQYKNRYYPQYKVLWFWSDVKYEVGTAIYYYSYEGAAKHLDRIEECERAKDKMKDPRTRDVTNHPYTPGNNGAKV